MCGIVGLLIKDANQRHLLGEWMVPMLIGMTERGPDSSGLAVFTEPLAASQRKYSLYAGSHACDWGTLAESFQAHFDTQPHITAHLNHAILSATTEPIAVKDWLKSHYPFVYILSTGRTIDLYKDTGSPETVINRYQFSQLSGSHLVGHTRMATESAVTPAHAHPFTAGEDFCLVHNGSLSNPYSIRRQLEPLGIQFETDNDTEAACRYLEWRMQEGDDLEAALKRGFEELDGFYTLLMGTANQLALVRDPFACKPAVIAETDTYVAIASEFRSLAHLPNINDAHVFEPAPEELYIWTL